LLIYGQITLFQKCPGFLHGFYREPWEELIYRFIFQQFIKETLVFLLKFSQNQSFCYNLFVFHIYSPYDGLFVSISLSTQSIITFIMYSFCLGVSSFPARILCHFSRQPLQQVAVACWAIKTGWPRIGVCFPSFGITAGASLFSIKS